MTWRWRPAGASALAGALSIIVLGAAARTRPAAAAHASHVQGQPVPSVTLLYQNFPNPFPTPGASFTCIWFDLHTVSQVRLTIHDIRGTLLRTLVPSAALSSSFPAGRFGRGDPDANTGCDHRFSWDGNDENGRRVPSGVYMVRLKTERFEGVKKIVYRGG